MSESYMPQSPDYYPIRLEADYPLQSSRLLALCGILLFVKALLLLPHLFVLYFVNVAAVVVMFVGYFAVLFTGHYPRGMYNFVLGVWRGQPRIPAWFMGLTDRYPPFGLR